MKIRNVVFVVLFILPIVFSLFFWEILSNREVLQEWAVGQNFFILFLLPIVQAAIIPLHNVTVNLFAGYVFGPWIGFLYAYFGWLIGASIAFWYYNRIKRGFAFQANNGKLEAIRDVMKHGWLLIVGAAVVPMIPDDLLVIGVASTGIMPYRKFISAFIIGLIPGKLVTCLFGDIIGEIIRAIFNGVVWTSYHTVVTLIFVLYFFIVFGIGFVERERIRKLKYIFKHSN